MCIQNTEYMIDDINFTISKLTKQKKKKTIQADRQTVGQERDLYIILECFSFVSSILTAIHWKNKWMLNQVDDFTRENVQKKSKTIVSRHGD